MVAQVETEPTFSPRTPEPLFGLSGYAIAGGDAGRRFDITPDATTPFNGLIFVENSPSGCPFRSRDTPFPKSLLAIG